MSVGDPPRRIIREWHAPTATTVKRKGSGLDGTVPLGA